MTQNKKTSVLILINVRWWNATAFYAVNIARILHRNGHKVVVGCNPGYPAYQKAAALGLETAALSFYSRNPATLMQSFLRMRRLIKKHGIDIVNAHRSEDHFFAILARMTTRAALVITRGDQRRIKPGRLSSGKYLCSDAVVATCRAIVEQNQHVFKPMAARVHVIYGSIDEENFSRQKSSTANPFSGKLDIPAGHPVIGLVGRLSPVKGQETFLRAAAIALSRRKDLRFVISGKEVEITIAHLRNRAKDLGIEAHCIFLPEVSRIADLMEACDICVTASMNSETISRVVLEYLYVGRPVIGTRVNAIAEIIQPGVNGELVNPEDPQALAAAILKLADNPGLRRRYAENSRDLYLRNYCEQVFYNAYAKVLQDACGLKNHSIRQQPE